jgi:transposase
MTWGAKMELREAKAIELADRGRVVQEKGGGWVVFSLNSCEKYLVVLGADRATCTCPDGELRQEDCKHVLAVRITLSRQGSGIDFQPVINTPPVKFPRKTYAQPDWAAYDAAQQDEKAEFQRLLFDLCGGLPAAPKSGTKGGRPPAPQADVLFATLFKVFSTLSGRRFATDLREAQAKGYVTEAVHHSTVARCLENPETTPLLLSMITASSLPLQAMEDHFAVDSSGFSSCKFDRWYNEKWGRMQSEHAWTKAHVIAGTTTHIVAAVEIHEKNSADAPQFPLLVKKAAESFTIREVAGDMAYPGTENFQVVEDCGGVAYLAFKSNTTGGVGGIYGRMFHLFCANKEDYLRRYHRRSNVESVFSSVKRKFGDAVRSKNDTAMKNEVLGKLVCHNLSCLIHTMYELGITPDLQDRPTPDTRPILRLADCR